MMCARRAAHAPSNDSEQMPHKLSYLGWPRSVRTRGRLACTAQRKTVLLSSRQGPRLGRNSSKKRFDHPSCIGGTDVFLRDPLGRLACLSAPAERQPMQKRTSFPAAKRALEWRLECGANSCNNNNNIYVSTNVDCTRPVRGDSLAGLGSLHAESATRILTALHSGGLLSICSLWESLPSMASFTPATSEHK